MTTPAKELGITGDFRIDGKDWDKFTNLSVAVSKNREFRNMLFISFNYESNISDTERTYNFVDEITTEKIYSKVIENKNITYNDVIEKNRGYLRGRLTPKSNRIDIIGKDILGSTHKYSFSIDTPENYNKVVDDIAGIKKQIEQKIDAKKADEQKLVQVAIEQGKLTPGATYDDLVNYNSLQEYIKAGKLKEDSTVDDYFTLKAAEKQEVYNKYNRGDDAPFGGRKTRRRKAHPSTKKHKKRTKHKKRASTKKHKKYKKRKSTRKR